MPVPPMHLHAVNFLERSKISRRRLTITRCLQSKRGDIRVAIGITTSHHLLAALCKVKKKEVESLDSEVDLFAPPPAAPLLQQQEQGKKALPSAPRAKEEGEGEEGLAKCTPRQPSHS